MVARKTPGPNAYARRSISSFEFVSLQIFAVPVRSDNACAYLWAVKNGRRAASWAALTTIAEPTDGGE
jgi:hypothetical protein